jgi:hypothetical protein
MSKVILVEGLGDADFITNFTRAIGKGDIEPFPPKNLGRNGNGISNVIAAIPLLLNKILAGDITKAAIVVDADYTGINGGFSVRRTQVAAHLSAAGYMIPVSPTPGAPPGEIFTHPDGRAPVGLYILPNHNNDGMMEDLLKQMVLNSPYDAVLQHAIATVGALPTKLYNPTLHTAKAEVGTFLAWQDKPPAFVGGCVQQGIFQANAPAAQDFLNWINLVF